MCEYIIAEDFDMDKYIFDEGNGLWYELIGDYYCASRSAAFHPQAVRGHFGNPALASR